MQSGPAQSANETTASPNSPPSTMPIVIPARVSLRKVAPPHTRVGRWRLLAGKSLLGTCKQFNPPLRQPREDCGLDQLVHARRDGRTDEQQYDAEHEPSALTDLQ